MTDSILTISASATRELTNDVLSIYFRASRSSANATTVQEELRVALNAAIEIVRPHAKPGEMEVETSGFSVSPRYSSKGAITNYEGGTTMTLKGTDTAGIATIAAKVTTMVVAGTGNSISRKLRTSVEKELTADAIAAFRVKAQEAAAAFGYKGYAPGVVAIGGDRGYSPRGYRAAGAMEAMGGSAPIEVESGKTEVSINVEGTVVLQGKARGSA
jgi:predicted secreted protein